jgi:hypothetical protein
MATTLVMRRLTIIAALVNATAAGAQTTASNLGANLS